MPRRENPSPARAGTAAIVGRPNVGKSTLLNALLDQDLAIVSSTPNTTRHALLGVVHHENAQIGFLDTPGIKKPKSTLGRQMNDVARGAVGDADVVVFVVEPGREMTVHPGDVTLLADVAQGRPIVLAINKVDNVRPRAKLMPYLSAIGALHDFAAVVPIAAKRKDGTDRLLGEIVALLPEREGRFGEDDLTDRPMRFFASEYIREQVLRNTHAEVPHASAVTIDKFEEKAGVVRIAATIHVEREGQKPILIGKGGESLKLIGTNARKKLERLLEKKVFLELFVRVTEGWTESPSLLRELGYVEE